MDGLKFEIEDDRPAGTRIKVIGVGGGGCDAAGRMYADGVQGVEFYALNTDRQALAASPIPNKLLIGQKVTGGLGAGADPNVGKEAALEDTERIIEILDGADMVFVAAGLGGGTGTGAAPVVASLAKELNALTVAIVTKPFAFEGVKRMKVADKGIEDLAMTVDTLIQIPNERLTTLMPKGTSLLDSFRATDDVLRQAVVGISDIMNTPGLINRDFADIRATLQGMGHAILGTASAKGENAAMEAARKAIHCPMLEGDDIKGARSVLINITASSAISLHDIHEACSLIRSATGNEEVQVNFGIVLDEKLKDEVKVAVIATGFQKMMQLEPISQARSFDIPPPSRVGFFTPPAVLTSAVMESEMSGPGKVLDIQAEPQIATPMPAMAAAASNGGPVSSHAGHDEPAKVQEDVDVPAFLRRDRRWFS
ncbi:MAG: cell division protein FtsZ [Bryobacterales bacterium]|nr:cell division protein FtsZ [Bryobacterales bacterium]